MHVISTRAQYDSRGEEISTLEATNQSMTEEQQELLRKLSETEHSLQAKKDECQRSQIKYVVQSAMQKFVSCNSWKKCHRALSFFLLQHFAWEECTT